MAQLDLFQATYAALNCNDIADKLALTHALRRDCLTDTLDCTNPRVEHEVRIPGRPPRPELVKPRDLSKRSIATAEGHAALIHSICHIEFNAINLALDAVYRFRGLPADYYRDWLQVADEEASHFEMLREHLRRLGYDYGDFPAHNGLWEMAQKTAHDPMVRMALVPRVLEARGLDVTPGIVAKLGQIDDQQAIAILDVIFHDEIGHVAIGSRWFDTLCRQRQLEPQAVFQQLIEEYMDGYLKGPFHVQARQQGGFSEAEIAYLQGIG